MILLFIVVMLGLIVGVTTRFFNNFGANIARNRLKELGIDEEPDDGETDSRLR